jgi:hypothetical protein
MSIPDEKSAWESRRNALYAAQATYLWVLFIACLFYSAVTSGPTDELRLPIVDVTLGRDVVSRSGPGVIAFLVLIIMGALRAATTAVEKCGIQAFEGEAFDHHPNALDLACYTTARSPRRVRAAMHFKYPTALTLALVVAAFLGWPPSKWVGLRAALVGVASGGLWIAAAWQVGSMWVRRVRQIPSLLERDRKARDS